MEGSVPENSKEESRGGEGRRGEERGKEGLLEKKKGTGGRRERQMIKIYANKGEHQSMSHACTHLPK